MKIHVKGSSNYRDSTVNPLRRLTSNRCRWLSCEWQRVFEGNCKILSFKAKGGRDVESDVGIWSNNQYSNCFAIYPQGQERPLILQLSNLFL